MTERLFDQWQQAFLDVVKQPELATPLKAASLAGDLTSWTTWLTAAVVASCDKQGWPAAARKHPLRLLPQMGQEYLGIDVMAFPDSKTLATTGQQWPLPLAIFELENVAKQERIEYSVWKLICLRTRLRVVFAYRSDWDQANDLVYSIGQGFIGRMTIEELNELSGDTVIVIGSRGEGETFPYGYFKYWRLNTNTKSFEKV